VLKRAHTPTTQDERRRDISCHRLLDPVGLPFLSQHHSTALTSPKRYGNRYEGGSMDRGNEHLRIYLPRTRVKRAEIYYFEFWFGQGVGKPSATTKQMNAVTEHSPRITLMRKYLSRALRQS
jgi:hypothetical protein